VVEAEGISAHGGTPSEGVNANGRLVLFLKQLPLEGKLATAITFLADKIGMEYDGKSLGIYLEDDLVSTEEGICVGSTADDVKSAYGEPSGQSTDVCLIYEKDGMTLSFNLTDGVVSTILYNDI
jgi:hypothetical protein